MCWQSTSQMQTHESWSLTSGRVPQQLSALRLAMRLAPQGGWAQRLQT